MLNGEYAGFLKLIPSVQLLKLHRGVWELLSKHVIFIEQYTYLTYIYRYTLDLKHKYNDVICEDTSVFTQTLCSVSTRRV